MTEILLDDGSPADEADLAALAADNAREYVRGFKALCVDAAPEIRIPAGAWLDRHLNIVIPAHLAEMAQGTSKRQLRNYAAVLMKAIGQGIRETGEAGGIDMSSVARLAYWTMKSSALRKPAGPKSSPALNFR